MEAEGLLPYLQECTAGPCLEPDEFSSRPFPHFLSLQDPKQ